MAIAFFSATQDIAVDAYRIEILRDEEQGAGSATTQLGYRIALWIVDAMALLLPSVLPWPIVLSLIALLIVVGIVTTFYAVEPQTERPTISSAEAWLKQAVVRPFAEFLAYRGWVVILLFALLYKYGDALGGSMARPFYVALGFTGPEIFGVTKSFGVGGDHPRRPRRRHRRRALRAVQGAADRRHPAGDHQPPLRLAGACGRMTCWC